MKNIIHKLFENTKHISFTKRYIFALTLIAMLSILAYINLSTLINKQSVDSKIINISGKQRMLSQKIALYSIYYKTKVLDKHIKLMKDSHEYLLALPMSKKIKHIYFSKEINLDIQVKEYLKHGELFFENRNGKSLSYLLNHSQIILKDLDYLVSIYQEEAEKRTKTLKENELFIFLLTIIVLFLEALLIFMPANKTINKTTNDLIKEINFSNTITESNTNAIIAISKNLEIIIYNESAVNMFGYTKNEMLGTKLLCKIIAPEYLDKHNISVANFFKNGILKIKDKSLELKGKRKNGNIFPIRISFGTNNISEDLIVVANIQDISDEKLKDKQLLDQSRYAAMGEMIGNIAHQWRQPLSAISSISSGSMVSLQLNVLNEKEVYSNFDKIKNHTIYLSNTIEDFRNFFKTESSNKKFKINDAINSAISLTKALYKNNDIRLYFETNSSDIIYHGKINELTQVIMNILHNSKDALIEKNVEEKVVLIKIQSDERKIKINIYDNAGGIKTSVLNRVFEPYFTTKHNSLGTGIGLFMSKEIIEKHLNGNLRAENSEFILDSKKYFGACLTCELNI